MHSDATLLLSHDVTAFVSRHVETFITLSTRVYLKTAGVILKKNFFSLLCNILLNNWENSAVVQSVASEYPKLHIYL